ncbi:MAG: TIGR04372 family glycosyltransferase, partial [Magnetococcales bacterium]|nr:TIGR04372 family glycosyltransferase [Magnetococcales bacterium]
HAFNIPKVGSNFPVLYDISQQVQANDRDIFIYKKYFSTTMDRPLTYEEILSSDIANYYASNLYEEAGILLSENTAEEILQATMEMEARLAHRYTEMAEAEALYQQVREIRQRAIAARQARGSTAIDCVSDGRISLAFARLNPGFLGP